MIPIPCLRVVNVRYMSGLQLPQSVHETYLGIETQDTRGLLA